MRHRKEQFEKLVDVYATDLHRFAIWLTKDPHTAQDILQETYVRAWRNLEQLESDESAKAWLLTILRNENARRFQRKQFNLVDIEDTYLAASESEAPDHQVEIQTLRKAIASLAMDYREPLVMQVLYGMSVREIAGHMELTESTVMTRLFRAKQKIKEMLTPKGEATVSRLFP